MVFPVDFAETVREVKAMLNGEVYPLPRFLLRRRCPGRLWTDGERPM